jgi:hypothetical protein
MAVDLETINETPYLLDLLLQMEDVLDTQDIYVFENWFDGVLVDGPKVRRYWLDMTLLYPEKKMPDPRAALRLLKIGARVDFQKVEQERTEAPEESEKEKGEEKEKSPSTEKVWLVRISIPRRLITELNANQLDFYANEIDIEDVQDAQDRGLSDESAFFTDQRGE